MMATKRVRNKNFAEKEKAMLMELIFPHKNVIENIKTDSINIRRKNQSWEDITYQYNCKNSETGDRTVAQLKTVYDMAKRRAKKELSYDKVSMYKCMKDITDEEQSIIVDLVNSYRSELLTSRPYQQDEVWSNILETYNLHQTTGTKTIDEIKQIFEHLNTTAKKENRNDKVERYKTGGGKYSKTMSDVSEQVLGIIGDRIEPLVNPFDDDISYTELMENHRSNNGKDVQEDSDDMDTVEVVTFDNAMESNISVEDFTYPGYSKIDWDMLELSHDKCETVTSNEKCETVTSNTNATPPSKPSNKISDLTYSTSSSKKKYQKNS